MSSAFLKCATIFLLKIISYFKIKCYTFIVNDNIIKEIT